MPITVATPALITDPGYLWWAPLLTAEPSNTVVGSKFTDTWSAGWVQLGATEDGSDFDYSVKVEAVYCAEFLDPVKWATTSRQGSFAFALSNWVMANWAKAVNGGTQTVVSGTTTTQLNKLQPPAAGAEVRAMLGWESTTNDIRLIMYQCINSGDIKSSFKKAPKQATIPCTFNFEIPSAGGQPWSMYTAGVGRV